MNRCSACRAVNLSESIQCYQCGASLLGAGAAREPQVRGSLVIRRAGKPYETQPLDRDTVTIGSSADSDLVLPDPMVSRRHAVLRSDANGALFLTDLDSSLGTALEGTKLSAGLPVRVFDGQTFDIGEFGITFRSTPAEERRVLPPTSAPSSLEWLDIAGALLSSEDPPSPSSQSGPPSPPSIGENAELAEGVGEGHYYDDHWGAYHHEGNVGADELLRPVPDSSPNRSYDRVECAPCYEGYPDLRKYDPGSNLLAKARPLPPEHRGNWRSTGWAWFQRWWQSARAGGKKEVDCAVWAPAQVRSEGLEVVHALLYPSALGHQARSLMREVAPAAGLRGTLGTRMRSGEEVTLVLEARGATLLERQQSRVWRGKLEQFTFAIEAEAGAREILGKLTLYQNDVPVGWIHFRIDVVPATASVLAKGPADTTPRRFETAFASHAHLDRREVLRRVQAFEAAGIRCFLDALDLRAAEEWKVRLQSEIKEADLFLLFWSSAARASEWVRWEWGYRLETRGRLSIQPIVIEGPPIPDPPAELGHIQFGDRMLRVIALEDLVERRGAQP